MAITLTERAAKHVQDYAQRHGQAGNLRLGVRTSGCSGFAYTVSYEVEASDDDAVFDQHGVRVVIDRKSLPFLEGMELDYIREGLNQRFDFRNPNVKESCGCGESVSF